jgi:hypothetical protein
MQGQEVKRAIFLAVRDSGTPAARKRWETLQEEASGVRAANTGWASRWSASTCCRSPPPARHESRTSEAAPRRRQSWNQHADIGGIGPVRPVTPPCRQDIGRPGVSRAFPGRPARARPVPAPLPARAGVLADGIQAGQRQNVPPMYLRRSSPPRGQSLGSRCVLTRVRTTLETGRGPDGNRHSSRTPCAESVLMPRPHAGR